MQVVNFTEARNNLKSIFDKVVQNSEEVIVNRKNGENVVILSLDKYNTIDETEYLLASKANAQQLRGSIESLKEGSLDEEWIDMTFGVMSQEDANTLLDDIQSSRVNKEVDLWS